MELANTKNEKFFDPTPRLKSSPIPIKFISFNKFDLNCIYCGEKYIETLLCHDQKYCKKCLSRYINDITDDNIYLDIYYTMVLEYSVHHEISKTKVPQKCCRNYRNCIRILYFKQIIGSFNEYPTNNNVINILYNKVIESEKHCKLCGKSLDERTTVKQLRLCSDCYLISFECVESTMFKKQVSILYLPWWHNNLYCINCSSRLIFISECQKYCKNCLVFYIGCRYCLTTNIIFGITGKTQCRRCKRISLTLCSNADCYLIDFFLNNMIYYNLDFGHDIANSIDKYFVPETLLNSIFKNVRIVKLVKWIPYSQFKNVKEITKGGYGIIYKAIWPAHDDLDREIILKRFERSKNNIKYFLNELISNQHCKNKPLHNYIIEVYGYTKEPESDDYILVMEYASEGDLHKYLQKNFTSIAWSNRYNQKLHILQEISKGLEYIHKNKFIHRDFHSGNILLDVFQWKIGDLGLSQSESSKSLNNEIYGVIPYIAPEIFKGAAFSKEADIYSFGMIMWELTTGCKPFANVEHDIHLIYKILDGERPNITEDTPKCYADLMKSCWDPDPKKRPSIGKIFFIIDIWYFTNENKVEFEQAEAIRKKLIGSKKIGPEFAGNCHPEAIYTSRPLSALISKCLSTNSSSTISFGNNQGTTTKNLIVIKIIIYSNL
ncbi:Cdc15p [Rhizophagus irregularis DAOM 197198w]|uniref:Cdc15p n=2 Tax=Rhizophagus irregularis TaxID=588596 RepID=A0A015JJQ5_RHIIW|nr:Cdc15p [Rhizophagus irregularis DAOM 197198w]